jgi:hypothetical protein
VVVEQAIVLVVALGLETDLVVAELLIAPGAVELERVLAVAGLAQDHLHGRPAAAPRTKSATAAHRLGLVPLLVAEDLAVAAAETTREPAVIEAATAWEAGDLAVVAAVAEVAAVVAVAAEEEEEAAADGDEKGR